jgi:hypothetical protein
MRTSKRVLITNMALIATVLAGGARVANAEIIYSWSGFVEPFGEVNPWGLSGDGSAVTGTDGTPYTIRISLDETTVDVDTANLRTASFLPRWVDLKIGDNTATFVRGTGNAGSAISFNDNDFDQFDSIRFGAEVSLLGTTLNFPADIRIPIDSFSLSDFGSDPSPTFETTLPIALGGAMSGNIVTIPANAPVSATVVPAPGAFLTALLGFVPGITLLLRRRRK